MGKPHFLSLLLLFILCTIEYSQQSLDDKISNYLNDKTKGASHDLADKSKFLAAHGLARAKKGLMPLMWDSKLAKYAQDWALKRKSDCELEHSFQDGQFTLGENIFKGSGSDWTPKDAVKIWMEEENNYSYDSNSCADGKMCGHYTQIVWRNTKKVGCARVICDNKDTFMICNYDPVGNVFGEKPY
ncbi:pathogenesis-related protein PR-1-like [Cannabis sativa]|uniref:SCP domain-containing protein n=2 Tax=Cannabis sativa TaxID=3483 RepID=A0AB40EB19_CANSA|nr:pathogenesis-related protein PR-1-like [Cannabis sativa]KAF4359738.1 hypothetical protein F8388_008300 [Cannabis sativa]KAF4383927.1 hypothetical protein G4B88_016360 [Cannabis sativa]